MSNQTKGEGMGKTLLDKVFGPEQAQALEQEIERIAEEKASSKVASLCGLVSRRLQLLRRELPREHETPTARERDLLVLEALESVFAEGLSQYGHHDQEVPDGSDAE